MRYSTVCLLILTMVQVRTHAQERDFTFGQVPLEEMTMTLYDSDSNATAVVTKEFGEITFEGGEGNLFDFVYHVRIKILTREALDLANVSVRIKRNDNLLERLLDVKAAAYDINSTGSITQTPFEGSPIYSEEQNKYRLIKKFAIPNVHVGSVIEYSYRIQSPFTFNLHRWEFQTELPKVVSDFWATIPGKFLYNIRLTGFLKLTTNKNEIVSKCFNFAGMVADCARYHFGMNNIPAFREEEYMTAPVNFKSAVDFEMSQMHYFDGHVERMTKEWSDVEKELRTMPEFGQQLRRGKDILKGLAPQLSDNGDSLDIARKVFDLIKTSFSWDGWYGFMSVDGIKKAFNDKSGSVADINLSLIAIFQEMGYKADPVLLSTRENGLITEAHPVLSDYNYVVARLVLGGKIYFLDATDDYFPFGMLPERCLNGKGRVFEKSGSYWIDLEPTGSGKRTTLLEMELDLAGHLKGKLFDQTSYYAAVDRRKEIKSFPSTEEYTNDLQTSLKGSLMNADIQHLDDPEEALQESYHFDIPTVDDMASGGPILVDPYIIYKHTRNPFNSVDRQYPVDFGAPIDWKVVIDLKYPEEYEISEIPDRIALALPGNGGQFLYEASASGHSIHLSYALNIRRTIYTPREYHYLKELFNQVIQKQNAALVFTRDGN